LGVKQLQPDVWETFFQQHHVGDVVHGKVLRVATFGAFVEIAEGIEASATIPRRSTATASRCIWSRAWSTTSRSSR